MDSPRPWVLTGGLILLVAGLAYTTFTVPPSSTSGTATTGPHMTYVIHIGFPYSITDHSSLAIEWSSREPVHIAVESCGSDPGCAGLDLPLVAQNNGTGGTLSFEASNEQYYGVYASGPVSFTYTGSSLLPFFYLALPILADGCLLLGAGLLWPSLDRPSRQRIPRKESRGPPKAVEDDLASLLLQLGSRKLVVIERCTNCGAGVKIAPGTSAQGLAYCSACGNPLPMDELMESIRKALAR